LKVLVNEEKLDAKRCQRSWGTLQQCGDVCITVWTPSRPTSAFSWRCVVGRWWQALLEPRRFVEQ